MQLTDHDQINRADLSPQRAVDVLCASGVLDSMPLMVAMARKHFSCSMRSRTAAVGNLTLGTRLTDERILGLGGTASTHYVADMDVALLDEKLQVWEFSLPSGTALTRHIAYQVVVNGETAQVQQIDVAEVAAPQSIS